MPSFHSPDKLTKHHCHTRSVAGEGGGASTCLTDALMATDFQDQLRGRLKGRQRGYEDSNNPNLKLNSSCYNKITRVGDLRQEECISSQLWSPEGQSQGVSGGGFVWRLWGRYHAASLLALGWQVSPDSTRFVAAWFQSQPRLTESLFSAGICILFYSHIDTSYGFEDKTNPVWLHLN